MLITRRKIHTIRIRWHKSWYIVTIHGNKYSCSCGRKRCERVYEIKKWH